MPLLHEILKRYWGYDSFRPLQHEIASHVMQGHDALGLMPTGGGKSIIFQTAGLAIGGLTIVVTPLISLMKDQVDNLNKVHVKAVCLHSGLTPAEMRKGWEKIVYGKANFLYTSPERLKSDRFIQEIRNLDVRLIVVDEAHCISQWGYDFRPSFMEISKLRKIFPEAPVLALTATATPAVAADIRKCLEFRPGHHTFQMSFQRRNISYIVRRSTSKLYDTARILQRSPGTAIVYVRNRNRTKEISDYLNNAGIPATFYHAGINPEVKTERQNLWKSGDIRVMIATNAFGMGIDKPDVRTVIHYDLPPSLEEYYQEAGRAGRDGLTSYAVLLYETADKTRLRRNVSIEFPERKVIRKVYERACNRLGLEIGEGYGMLREFDIEDFCRTFKMQEQQVKASLTLLGRAGYLEYLDELDNSTRVMMSVTREELYELRDIPPMEERVLKCVLRCYTGLFADYVYINEKRVARESGTDLQTVYESLLSLGRRKVISFIPRAKAPYIYVPTSREDPEGIIIPRAIYEERKKIMERRVEAMIGYAEEAGGCRVRGMLEYFGEPDPSDCGRCDICRNRVKERRPSDRELRQRVIDMLSGSPSGMTVQRLEESFGRYGAEAFRQLRYLIDDGVVEHAGIAVRINSKYIKGSGR